MEAKTDQVKEDKNPTGWNSNLVSSAYATHIPASFLETLAGVRWYSAGAWGTEVWHIIAERADWDVKKRGRKQYTCSGCLVSLQSPPAMCLKAGDVSSPAQGVRALSPLQLCAWYSDSIQQKLQKPTKKSHYIYWFMEWGVGKSLIHLISSNAFLVFCWCQWESCRHRGSRHSNSCILSGYSVPCTRATDKKKSNPAESSLGFSFAFSAGIWSAVLHLRDCPAPAIFLG